ncbi:MAG: hypothetical protein NT076_00885 [Candidatus Pacearchaeota archaeon]|nr:hypothetical protein [Candidatus Pacearchaeota archaeon]
MGRPCSLKNPYRRMPTLTLVRECQEMRVFNGILYDKPKRTEHGQWVSTSRGEYRIDIKRASKTTSKGYGASQEDPKRITSLSIYKIEKEKIRDIKEVLYSWDADNTLPFFPRSKTRLRNLIAEEDLRILLEDVLDIFN